MTDEELLEIVENLRKVGGDHLDVEVKASETELPKKLWHTLSAFANTAGGGVLLLGLDEKTGFATVGVRDPKQIQQHLGDLCSQMEPPLRAQIRPHQFEGKTVIVAEIPEVDRTQKPCYYSGSGHLNGSFVRVGDGNRQLTNYEVHLLIASRGQPQEDREGVPAARLEDLERARVRGLLRAVRSRGRRLAQRPDDEVLRALGVLVPHDKRLVPSLAGLLALGQHPQAFFPGLYVQFVVFPKSRIGEPDDEDVRFLDNVRIEGCLAEVVEEVLAALRRHMSRKTSIRGAKRRDTWQYPETALREAIVNALVHRDLSSGSRGTPVQVQMFPDRLVISNPGGLFGPVTIDRLGESGASAARNATLLRILEDAPGADDAPICENRGTGIGAMIYALGQAGLEPPRFDDRISTFQVTFPSGSLLDDETIAWLSRFDEELSETQRRGLAMLRHGHVLDNITFRQATGLDSRVATRELGELVDRGILEQIGTRRWATYRLASGGTQRRDRRPEILALLRRRGQLSRKQIALELDLSDAAVRQWLPVLRTEGLVELIGAVRSPHATYRVKEAGERRSRKGRR